MPRPRPCVPIGCASCRPPAPAAQQLAQRLPYTDYKMERLLLLNGVDSGAELMRLPQVKIIEP